MSDMREFFWHYIWVPLKIVDAFESHEGLLDPKRIICIWLDRVVTNGIRADLRSQYACLFHLVP